jgi:hypothetical protein
MHLWSLALADDNVKDQTGRQNVSPGDYKLTFGTYRNRKIAEVYKTDRRYVLWLRDQTQGPAQKAAEEFIKSENMLS